jgi:hypothetical protein
VNKARPNRRTIAADVLGLEHASLKPYQAGRHTPPVFDDGDGAVTVTFEGEKPPEGWTWKQKATHNGGTVWVAVEAR